MYTPGREACLWRNRTFVSSQNGPAYFPARLACGLVSPFHPQLSPSWVLFFPRLPWVTAGFLQQPSALPWTCWDLKYGRHQHPCSMVSSNNSNMLLWDIIQWEHFDSEKKKKLESSLFQLIHFIMSHWYVNFCFKLLKLILYWVAMIWGKMCYFCKWMSV